MFCDSLIIKLVSACEELFYGMVVIWYDYLVVKALKCVLPSHLLVSERKEVIVSSMDSESSTLS